MKFQWHDIDSNYKIHSLPLQQSLSDYLWLNVLLLNETHAIQSLYSDTKNVKIRFLSSIEVLICNTLKSIWNSL